VVGKVSVYGGRKKMKLTAKFYANRELDIQKREECDDGMKKEIGRDNASEPSKRQRGAVREWKAQRIRKVCFEMPQVSRQARERVRGETSAHILYQGQEVVKMVGDMLEKVGILWSRSGVNNLAIGLC
jgi:hypothetical protein